MRAQVNDSRSKRGARRDPKTAQPHHTLLAIGATLVLRAPFCLDNVLQKQLRALQNAPRKHQTAAMMKARCISKWGSWSGAYPFIKDFHKRLGKCQKNITLLGFQTQFSQQNNTNGTFSLTNLSLWDERLASRARQSRWVGWLRLIKLTPVPCFDCGFPVGPQQSPCLLSTGRALKMEYEL